MWYQPVATRYRIDRGLDNLSVVSADDPRLADVTCPIGAIQDIYSFRDDNVACFPSEVVSCLRPQDHDLLLMITFRSNDSCFKFCILMESAETRDVFLEALRTLCAFMQEFPAR